MSANWINNIKYVNPGEPVQAGVVNRPDQTLADRTDYLRDRLDAAAVGEALFDNNATIASDVLPGQPVYWNYTSKQYEKALAGVTATPNSQTFALLPSSDCVGLCLRKRSPTLGDIVLHGVVSLPELQNAIATPLLPDGVHRAPVNPGRYYLSAAEAGKLVQQKPGVTVPVCYVQGPRDDCSSQVPRVIVMPQARDFIEEHTHYRFDLTPLPAGLHDPDAALTTGRHVITDPNAALPGWLPANHASFNNKAPTGALFGYNLSKHPALANVWPPLPIQSVCVLWDRGAKLDDPARVWVGATEIPMGPNGLVVCDLNGIWWMNDCYGDVPWPAALDTTMAGATEEESADACPRAEDMRVSVVFLRATLGNDRSVVTSLQPDTDSPITVTNCAGQPATTGDLALNLNMPVLPGDAIGGQVFKELVNGRKLRRGWVADGVFTLSEQLVISGSRQSTARPVTITIASPAVFTAPAHGYIAGTPVRFETTSLLPTGLAVGTTYYVLGANLTTNTFQVAATPNGTAITTTGAQDGTHTVATVRVLTPAEKTSFDIPAEQEVLVQQGVIKIDYTDNLVEREIAPQIIRLGDAVERLYLDIPYIGFPAGQASLIRLRFNVPDNIPGANLKMRTRVQFFGRGGSVSQSLTLPALYMSYRVLPAPALGSSTGVTLPATDTSITFESAVSLPIDTVVTRQSAAFPITPGSTVLVTLGRNDDPADVYPEVGILRVMGIVVNDQNNVL